jgi:hypothetical protein
MMVVKQAPFGKEEGACADAGRQVCVLILPGNPVKQALIMPFAACSLPARDNQNIKRWVILSRCVWLHK